MKEKTHIYFVPGLAASCRIFEYIKLPEDRFALHFLEWIIPLDGESLRSYAKRYVSSIQDPDPVLVGVSFGGMLVQELSMLIPAKKVIIISSLKSNNEMPKYLRWIKKTGLYKLFPTRTIAKERNYSRYPLSGKWRRKAELYDKYLNVRDEKYLNWSIRQALNWQQTETPPGVVHIHGTRDEIFPAKRLDGFIPVEGGNHAMILTRAGKISKLIENILAS